MGAQTKTNVQRVLGGYELLGLLGKGSTGSVYKARQIRMDRIVAVKVLWPALAMDQNYVARFEHEARTAAKLSHPNVIQAIDVGEAGGCHYFVMEYVQGATVDRLISECGMLAEGFCLNVAAQIVRAIQAAEGLGMVHLDIKPGNILITRNKVAKLADFGLARKTMGPGAESPTEILGTLEYLSPEQALGEAGLDSRSDIYSLGVTLYKMLTGQLPFKGNSPREIVDARFFDDPAPLAALRSDLSSETCAIVHRMLARDRQDRYQNASELLTDLEYVLALRAGKPATAARPKDRCSTDQVYAMAAEPARRTRGKSMVPQLVAIVLLAALGFATFWLVRNTALGEAIAKGCRMAGITVSGGGGGAPAH